MLIESRLILTKSFPRGVSKLSFGKYQISPLSYFSSTEIEALLSFSHQLKDSGETGHPEEEVDIICRLLSVFLNARIRKLGTSADENNIPVFDGRERLQYPQFFGYLDPASLDDLIKRALTLDEDLARQFIRACKCYSYALEMIPSDPAFSFFLLITAGKCVSSRNEIIPHAELDPVEKESERFINFIIRNMPDDLIIKDDNNGVQAEDLLQNASFYHRHAFIHDGKEIASALREADKSGTAYARITIDDKEINIPGLVWMSKAVRGALIGYLQSLAVPSSGSVSEHLFSTIALEKAKLKK